MISQSLESQVSIESVLTQNYKVESRRNKNGKFKVYKCFCGRKHHSRHQIKSHKLSCQKRVFQQKQNQRLVNEEQIIDNRSWHQIILPQQQIQNLKLRLSIVERNQLYPPNNQSANIFDPYLKAKDMFEKYSGAISGIIINKLATSLEHAFKANIKIIQIQNFIAAAVIGKLQSLSFDDCIQVFSDKLAKCHKLLIEQSGSKKEKTQKYNQRAFNFLSQFNQFQLGTQIQLFDELLKLEPTQRKNVCRYFSKIRKIDPYFAKFPQIPKLYKQIPRGIMLSKTSIDEAAIEIRNIYVQGNKVLACDMWLIITMGLRFHDLLRLFFYSEDKIVKFFKLKQQKNNNICSRYVPKSLIQIILQSKTEYPATESRLRFAVKQCLKRFGSSYGFKHRAITIILAALHRANPLGRMHARPEMTSKHYIDQNDEKFIDEGFKIGIKFCFTQVIRKKIDERDIQIDLTSRIPCINKVVGKFLGQITLQCENTFSDRLLTSALDGNFNVQTIGLNKKQIYQLNQICMVSKNHQIQLFSDRYSTIEQAISQLGLNIIDATEILVNQEGEDIDNQIIINKLSQIIGRKISFYEFDQIDPQPRVLSSEEIVQLSQEIVQLSEEIVQLNANEQISQIQEQIVEQIVISKNKKGFAISAKNIVVNFESLSAILGREKNIGPKYLHRSFAPNCLNCRIESRCSKLQSIESGVKCRQCGWKQQSIGKLYPLVAEIVIECSNRDQVSGYRCVKLKNSKNNLLQTINRIYPGKGSNKLMYSNDFPKKITTTFKRASHQFERQIKKCRKNIERLPFSIQQSTIFGANLGVFATQNIKSKSLLLTYDGLIGTSFSVFDKETKNSLFEAGWVISSKEERKCFQVLIDGEEIVGPARFINSSKRMTTSNITASTVICENEILIYFVASQDIKSGEELLFYYGNKYWQQLQANEPYSQQRQQSQGSLAE